MSTNQRDYSEIWLSIKVKMRALELAISTKNYPAANSLSEEIVIESKNLETAVKNEQRIAP